MSQNDYDAALVEAAVKKAERAARTGRLTGNKHRLILLGLLRELKWARRDHDSAKGGSDGRVQPEDRHDGHLVPEPALVP